MNAPVFWEIGLFVCSPTFLGVAVLLWNEVQWQSSAFENTAR